MEDHSDGGIIGSSRLGVLLVSPSLSLATSDSNAHYFSDDLCLSNLRFPLDVSFRILTSGCPFLYRDGCVFARHAAQLGSHLRSLLSGDALIGVEPSTCPAEAVHISSPAPVERHISWAIPSDRLWSLGCAEMPRRRSHPQIDSYSRYSNGSGYTSCALRLPSRLSWILCAFC